jgi:glycosyltransferase involved in cell wall biosynthesis
MNIALVASIVTPIRRASANGPHAVIGDLARGLLARGHDVTVYGAAGSEVPGVQLVEIEVDPAVREAVILPDRVAIPHSDVVYAAFDRLAAELRRRRPDVISQHAFDAEAIDLLEGLPVLHTLHLPPVVPAVIDALFRTSALLAAPSRHAAHRWSQLLERDVAVLRNGVPDRGWTDLTNPGPDAVGERHAIIAGRISPEKGTAIAIRAACRAGLRPVLVGDIYDRDYYEREAEPLLADVTFLGPRSRRSLAVLLAHAAVLVVASQWDETFGLVAAEAQMSGCPVVGYRRGALPEVVSDGLGGHLVTPDDEAALTAALRNLDGFDRHAIRADALARLHADEMVDRYESTLTELAASAARPVA